MAVLAFLLLSLALLLQEVAVVVAQDTYLEPLALAVLVVVVLVDHRLWLAALAQQTQAAVAVAALEQQAQAALVLSFSVHLWRQYQQPDRRLLRQTDHLRSTHSQLLDQLRSEVTHGSLCTT